MYEIRFRDPGTFMTFGYFSRNGKILPIADAAVPLSDIAYQYGFGVYETVRVAGGSPRFLDEHTERLLQSARLIGLRHAFSAAFVASAARELIGKNQAGACNLKILLVGGASERDAALSILCLNPHYPEKSLYRDGVRCITRAYERPFPHAKSLNMLQSYLAYREAREKGAYEALLIDRRGAIREGTRSNFFCMRGNAIVSPPEEQILLGVTRAHALDAARECGIAIEEKEIRPEDLPTYEGAFLIGTSSNIMPIRAIDGHGFGPRPAALGELMRAFERFLGAHGAA